MHTHNDQVMEEAGWLNVVTWLEAGLNVCERVRKFKTEKFDTYVAASRTHTSHCYTHNSDTSCQTWSNVVTREQL